MFRHRDASLRTLFWSFHPGGDRGSHALLASGLVLVQVAVERLVQVANLRAWISRSQAIPRLVIDRHLVHDRVLLEASSNFVHSSVTSQSGGFAATCQHPGNNDALQQCCRS